MYPDDSLTLHTDLYQINMMQVYFEQGIHNKKAVFEAYFRQQPFKNGYAVFAGLGAHCQLFEESDVFLESDIAYLESLGYRRSLPRLPEKSQNGIDRSFCQRRGSGLCQ